MSHYSDLAKQLESLPEGFKARWSFRFKNRESFYDSLPQLLESCAEKIKQSEEEGLGVSIKLSLTRPRTQWPMVLVVDRDFGETLHYRSCGDENCLNWVDSCGNRSVFWYGPKDGNYDDAIDLPFVLFDQIKAEAGPDRLCRRMPDPGLGIDLDEDMP